MNKFENEHEKACGTAAEEIKDQDMSQDVAGGLDSAAIGNKGYICTATLECNQVCRAVRWSSWAICK